MIDVNSHAYKCRVYIDLSIIMLAKAEYTLSSLTLPVEEALEALILKTKQKFLKCYNKKNKDLSSSLFPPLYGKVNFC
jgi:hypothetical protein